MQTPTQQQLEALKSAASAKGMSELAYWQALQTDSLRGQTATQINKVSLLQIAVDEQEERQNAALEAFGEQLGGHYFKGMEKTTAAGNATQSFYVPGVKFFNKVVASIKTLGETPVTILTAKCINDNIQVVFSADPGNDHVITLLTF